MKSSMSSQNFIYILISLIFITLPHQVKSYPQQQQRHLDKIRAKDPSVYTNYEVLDKEGKIVLEWVVNWEEKRILFNVTARTRGYVGFGLSKNGLMAGADIVIGGVNKSGEPYFSDRYGVAEQEPKIDPQQDWKLHEAWEGSFHTFLSFSRAFDTCDENDYPINEFDQITLIWAIGEVDATSQYHFGNRGTYPVYLLDPNIVPRALKEATFQPGPPSTSLLIKEDLQLWTVTTADTLPEDHTAYLCSIRRGPRLHKKHHIVGYHTRLETEEGRRHLHHILFFRCIPPRNSTARAFFERYVGRPGQECTSFARPLGDIPTIYCSSNMYVFGIGGRIHFYPDHFGDPIGDTGEDEYYLIQLHYDNPDRKPLTIPVNLDIYYTDKLRPHDGTMMTLGKDVPSNPSILIPPSSLDHKIYGHCSPDCTRKILPPEGINIALAFLHTHYSGRKVKLRHVRGNKELPWIANDDNYANNFQPNRLFNTEVNVQPGDQLIATCEYDNSWYNGTTVGAYSTRDEMCLIYIYYYNSARLYPLCRSDLFGEPLYDYLHRFLGVNNITWSFKERQNIATSPRHLAGRTMSSIADTEVDWTIGLRKELQEDHKHRPQLTRCVSALDIINGNFLDVNTEMVSVPQGLEEYFPPPRQCSAKKHPSPGPGWSGSREKYNLEWNT